MVFGGVAANFAGLFLCGFLIKTKKAARRLYLCSYAFFVAASAIFFFPPSVFWRLGVIISSFLAGGCVAAWGFYFKSGTPRSERTKTAADVLICSSLLMTLLNVIAIYLSPIIGLAASMLMIFGAFIFALRLPADDDAVSGVTATTNEEPVNIAGSLALLCLFILIIAINSGLMYEVINPAFAHHEWLTSWYWAMPKKLNVPVAYGRVKPSDMLETHIDSPDYGVVYIGTMTVPVPEGQDRIDFRTKGNRVWIGQLVYARVGESVAPPKPPALVRMPSNGATAESAVVMATTVTKPESPTGDMKGAWGYESPTKAQGVRHAQRSHSGV